MKKLTLTITTILVITAIVLLAKQEDGTYDFMSIVTSKSSKEEQQRTATKKQLDAQIQATNKRLNIPKNTNAQALRHAAMDERAANEGIGDPEPVTQDNPATEQIREALSDPAKHGSTLSSLISAKPFDAAKYLNSADYKKQYLESTEPSRAYVQNVNATQRVSSKSPYYHEVEQGKFVTLKVQGPPNAPYTVTAFKGGRFENGLRTMTAEFPSGGIASIKFYGTSGSYGNTKLRVASPMGKGHAEFKVRINLPEKK